MSNLIASNYRATSSGYLPNLISPEIIENAASTVASPQSATKGGATFCNLTSTGIVAFTPAVVPPIGAIKDFYQKSGGAQAAIQATNNCVFVQGPTNTLIATQVLLTTAYTQYARFQYIGLNTSGLQMYRLLSTTGTPS